MRLQITVFLVLVVGCLGQPINDKKLYDVEKIGTQRFISGLAVNEKFVVIGYPSLFSRGKIEVFENKPGYRFIKRLEPNDLSKGSFFGHSIAANNDYIVVGALWDNRKYENQGAVYVFESKEGKWTYQRLEEPFPGEDHLFGRSVAINENNELVVGAWSSKSRVSKTDSGIGKNAGAAYTYALDNAGKWVLKQTLIPKGHKAGDFMGASVAIENDYLAVAAESGASNQNGAGTVYIFKKTTTGLWVEDTKLNSRNPKKYGGFGNAMAMHGDRIIIGAMNENHFDGNAYIYVNSNGKWTLESQLTNPGGRHQYGREVAMNGNVAAAGTTTKSDVHGQTYKRTDGKWVKGKVLNHRGKKGYFKSLAIWNGKIYGVAKDGVYVFTNAS